MKNNKKIIIITSIILGVLILTISLTYAVFSMSKTSKNSNLVVGDVYMHYANGNKSINLANVMPSETYDATSFFEFTIDGKNTTTNKDIWYEIILKHGDEVSGKTRIKDNLLKFTLTETKNGTTTTVFDGRSYGNLTNKRIWVNTINKNTTSEVSITYRLYMWISNNTVIGNVNQDYTTDEWKNIFASIKVDVAGDFNEKSIATNESCFTVGTINDGNEVAILNYDETCGTDVIIPNTIKGYPVTVIGNSSTRVIEQLSNKNNDYNFNDLNNYQQNVNIKPTATSVLGSFREKNLTSVIIPDSVTTIGQDAFSRNQLTSVIIPKSVTTIEMFAFTNNRLTDLEIPKSVTTIGSSVFADNQLTSIVIPDGVTTIEDSAFSNNQLTSIVIPDSVTTIEESAFSDNQLTSIVIPDGVTAIGNSAFAYNQLTSVTIGNGIQYINRSAFSKEDTSNPNLVKITINKTCSDIKNITESNISSIKYYPWLTRFSPYTASGVTIYGSNNEICDSF